jgi:hypothetical protein
MALFAVSTSARQDAAQHHPALMSGSPAIDAGNNTANDPHTGVPAPYDQRGMGYARVSGNSADIGVHEVRKNDIVFTAGMDGCP